MEEIFLQLITKSLIAVPFICVIMLLRYLLKRFPRAYIYAMWMLLLVELVYPFSYKSPIGLLPQFQISAYSEESLETQPEKSVGAQWELNREADYFTVAFEDVGARVISSGEPRMAPASQQGKWNQPDITTGLITESKSGGRTLYRLSRHSLFLISFVWLVGCVFLFGRHCWQLLQLKKRVVFAVKGEDVVLDSIRRGQVGIRNIWETEGIASPFILPGVRSRIYLPFGLDQKEKKSILAHEYYHLHYLHPWIKWLASFILIVHWFNPFVWIAVRLLAQDMEIICDDAALKCCTGDERKEYARILLKYSMKSSGLQPCLAFGESGTESRIQYLTNVKKPGRVIAVLLLAMVPLCFLGCMPEGRAGQAIVNGTDSAGKQTSGTAADRTTAAVDMGTAAGTGTAAAGMGTAADTGTAAADMGTVPFIENKSDVTEQDPATLYQEPVLHLYIPEFYIENGYTDPAKMPEDKYEGLARQALRELYQLTGTEIEECCYFYSDLGGFVFGLTEEDLEHGRDFYSRYFGENEQTQFPGIASVYLIYADNVWYSPVQQLSRPQGFDKMSAEEMAVYYMEQSGVYNGQHAVSCFQPYSEMMDTWRTVMEDGTAYEITLDLERDLVTSITGPYPDKNINH